MAVQKKIHMQQSKELHKSPSGDEEYTFKPKINKKSQEMPARSHFEMSRGDFLKKERSRRMIKLQNEEAVSADMTFKPAIMSQASKNTQPVLQLSVGTSEYLQWLNSRQAEKKAAIEAELRRREEEEIKDCSFKPKTIDCPGIVLCLLHDVSESVTIVVQ